MCYLQAFQHASDKPGCVLCSLFLKAICLAFTPVTNPLHNNPWDVAPIRSSSDTSAFHLATNCLWLNFPQHSFELRVIDQFFSRKKSTYPHD